MGKGLTEELGGSFDEVEMKEHLLFSELFTVFWIGVEELLRVDGGWLEINRPGKLKLPVAYKNTATEVSGRPKWQTKKVMPNCLL